MVPSAFDSRLRTGSGLTVIRTGPRPAPAVARRLDSCRTGAAVHVQRLPGAEAGSVRGEEQDAVSDLLRLTEPAGGVRLRDRLGIDSVPLRVVEQGGGTD